MTTMAFTKIHEFDEPNIMESIQFQEYQINQLNRKRKRKVCFSSQADNVHYLKDVPPASALTTKERDSIWYTNNEMIRMKSDAIKLARKIRMGRKKSLMNSQGESNTIEDETRGLEPIIFLKRQVQKKIALQSIMECQRKIKAKILIAAMNGDPNLYLIMEAAPRKLADVSAYCSQWSNLIALAMAQSDFENVYCSKKTEEEDLMLMRLEMRHRFLLKNQKFMMESKRKRITRGDEGRIDQVLPCKRLRYNL